MYKKCFKLLENNYLISTIYHAFYLFVISYDLLSPNDGKIVTQMIFNISCSVQLKFSN